MHTQNDKKIKEIFFKVVKECISLLASQNGETISMEVPSIDIGAFAKKCGITDIKCVPPESILNKHALLIDTVIYVNEQDSREKQRFAIAHEIFHFLTQWPRSAFTQVFARHGEAWKQQNAGSPEAVGEVVSDYFAANLLIPAELFILHEDKADEEIASAFGVEPKCIKRRREEIEHELDFMAPKDLSSNVKIEEQTPLTLDELDHILEGHSIHAAGRT